MRILHVADFVSEKTGYQDFLLPKQHALNGHEVHVITSCMNPPAPDYVASLEPLLGPRHMSPRTYVVSEVTIHRLPVVFEWRDRVVMKGLHRECSAVRPEAIFVHNTMTPTALLMCHVAASLGVPVYFDNHSIFSVQNRSWPARLGYSAFRKVMRYYMAPRSEAIFGVANECVDFLVKAQGVPLDKVALLPLGIDTSLFRPDPDAGRDWRQANGISQHAFVVTQTGKLDRAKDPMTLAQAVAILPAGDRPLHLVLVGAGRSDYVDSLVSTVRDAGVHTVDVLPPVEVSQLSAVFNGSDVMCYPGGTSMSALEAAACGRLVIMNDESVSQWRADKGIGFTFTEGDPASLASLLTTVRDMSEEERAAAGIGAYESAVREFSYDSIARSLEDRMANDVRAGRSQRRHGS